MSPTFIESAISLPYCIGVTDDIMTVFFYYYSRFYFNDKTFDLSLSYENNAKHQI